MLMYKKYIILLYFVFNSEASNIHKQTFFPQSYTDKSISRCKQQYSSKEERFNNFCKTAVESIKQFRLSSKLASDISIVTFGLTFSLWMKNLIFPHTKQQSKSNVNNSTIKNNSHIYSGKKDKIFTKAEFVTEENVTIQPDITLKIYFNH